MTRVLVGVAESISVFVFYAMIVSGVKNRPPEKKAFKCVNNHMVSDPGFCPQLSHQIGNHSEPKALKSLIYSVFLVFCGNS